MQRNENPARLEYLTYRPSCGYEHLADPDERIIHMMCPDGAHHYECQCGECTPLKGPEGIGAQS